MKLTIHKDRFKNNLYTITIVFSNKIEKSINVLHQPVRNAIKRLF